MSIFLVIYDLRRETEFDYQVLWDELERLDAIRTQPSAWHVDMGDVKARQTVNHFRQFTHDRDRIMAVKLFRGTYVVTKR